MRRRWSSAARVRFAEGSEIAAHLGEVLWVQGEKDEARRFFDESRKLQPDDNRALQRALEKTGA